MGSVQVMQSGVGVGGGSSGRCEPCGWEDFTEEVTARALWGVQQRARDS